MSANPWLNDWFLLKTGNAIDKSDTIMDMKYNTAWQTFQGSAHELLKYRPRPTSA